MDNKLKEIIAYRYIPRIAIPGFPVRGGKKYLNPEEFEKLLDGNIVVEEKLDGKLTKIDIDVRASYECYAEDLHWKHNIFYNRIPISSIPFMIGIDICDTDFGEYIDYKNNIFAINHIARAPTLLKGRCELNEIILMLDSKSEFGDQQIEGVVIKNYKNGIFGKIVNPKFDNEVDDSEHWLRKKRVSNRINKEALIPAQKLRWSGPAL